MIDNFNSPDPQDHVPVPSFDLGDIQREMVAHAVASGGSVSGLTQNRGFAKWDSHSDTVEIERAPMELPAGAEPERVHDTGYDLQARRDAIQADIDKAHQQLSEVTYDPKTGQPAFTLSGEARRIAQAKFHQLLESAQHEVGQLERIKQQREADAATKEAKDRERIALEMWSNGDPARAEMLKNELTRAEAAHYAQLILKARRGG